MSELSREVRKLANALHGSQISGSLEGLSNLDGLGKKQLILLVNFIEGIREQLSNPSKHGLAVLEAKVKQLERFQENPRVAMAGVMINLGLDRAALYPEIFEQYNPKGARSPAEFFAGMTKRSAEPGTPRYKGSASALELSVRGAEWHQLSEFPGRLFAQLNGCWLTSTQRLTDIDPDQRVEIVGYHQMRGAIFDGTIARRDITVGFDSAHDFNPDYIPRVCVVRGRNGQESPSSILVMAPNNESRGPLFGHVRALQREPTVVFEGGLAPRQPTTVKQAIAEGYEVAVTLP